MAAMADNLVWIDLEMTGLNPDLDHVIEVATIVTDAQLHLVAEGPVIAIHQSEPVLAGMDDWNRRTHGESGLAGRVRRSIHQQPSIPSAMPSATPVAITR